MMRRQERRKYPRKLCAIDMAGATWRGSFRGTIQNISYGGMFVETQADLSPRDEIAASVFASTKKDPIRINGEIVWSGPKGVGVRFTARPCQALEDKIASL